MYLIYINELGKDYKGQRQYEFIFGKDKDEVMRKFTVFAHPSRNECLPTAVLEAASMGLPCVVTAATNMGEVIKKYNAGEMVQDADALQLKEALSSINWKLFAGNPGEIAGNARRMVATEFNWNTIVNKFDTLYRNN